MLCTFPGTFQSFRRRSYVCFARSRTLLHVSEDVLTMLHDIHNFSTLPKIDSTPDTALPSDETLAEFCCCVALAINWGKECGNGELEAMKLLTLLVLRAFLSN